MSEIKTLHHSTTLDSLVCHKYIQRKSTGDSSGLPFICGFLSCSLWLCYARVTNDPSIRLVNIVGSALFFLYTLVYYVFTVNKSALLKQFSVALLILMLCFAYVQSQENVTDAKDAVGKGLLSTIYAYLIDSKRLSSIWNT